MDITNYIGKIVKVKIDRPIGFKKPEFPTVYAINYGYVPDTVSGDGDPIDVYVVGVFEKLDTYEGEVIAIIHRLEDEDDKLIVAPKGKKYTKEQIEALTEFQERFYKSTIIM